MSATLSKKITPDMLRAIARAELDITPSDTSIPRRDVTVAPMSYSQSRVWFIQQLEPTSAVYVIPIALRLIGSLDTVALRSALDEIVRRHAILRTVFCLEDGEPVQRIQSHRPVELPITSLLSLDSQQKEREAQRLIREESESCFDLSAGRLFRASLIQLEPNEHILLLTAHHIVFDGWSSGIVARELEALYNASRTGRPCTLPDLPIQFSDYAAWQRESGVMERDLGYWRDRLTGFPNLLELPFDRPRPSSQTYNGALFHQEIPPELARAVTEIGQAEGATPFMTLLALFQVLLLRYSGQDLFLIGTPVANRPRPELEGLIGFFLNTLVLRADLSAEPTFVELLRRVREDALGAFAHQNLPFEKLVDELQPERSLSHSPLFQVLFTVQNRQERLPLCLDDLRVESARGEWVTSKFDLSLLITQERNALRTGWEYNTDLFHAATIERMAGHYRQLLESVIADPHQPVTQLPILTEQERLELASWNQTNRDYPLEGGIHDLIEAQAAKTPDAPAAAFEGSCLTYAELNARANRLAHWLRNKGAFSPSPVGTAECSSAIHCRVTPDKLVGLHMERSVELVVSILAILKAGGAYVPLDPTYPSERLAGMIRDAEPAVVLTNAVIPADAEIQSAVSFIPIEQAEKEAESESSHNPEPVVSGDNLAYMIYTSGSTGTPKGAMNTHSAIRNRLLWMQDEYGLTGEDRVLQKTPYSFDVSVWEFLWPLMTGACLVVARPEGHKDPAYLSEVIGSEQITTLHFVPSMLRAFLTVGDLDTCKSLKRVICSGEALPPDLVQQFFDALPNTELHNLYGPTEAAIDVTYYACSKAETQTCIPIGRPIANTKIHILDRNMSEVPVNVPGELYIGGANLGRGYLNRPDLTAERFIPGPCGVRDGGLDHDGGGEFHSPRTHAGESELSTLNSQLSTRLYRTGDLCRRLPDGNIEFLGRLDHQVKVRGFRIELGEIEASLLGHVAVSDCVVVARHENLGESRLVAYVVGEVSAAELRDHLKATLPDYMIPSAFVTLESLPLSANGKVDRKALPEPDSTRIVESEYEEPVTYAHRKLAEIWREVLRLERVGIHDNFFELGGDSIRSIHIIARANQAGLHLTPRQIFQHQTIAELAEVAGQGVTILADQGRIEGPVPLTPIQRWFFEDDASDLHHFNQARLLKLDRSVTAEIVERVLTSLVDHHDALRLRFPREGARITQFNAADETDRFFSQIDLSAVAQAELEQAITEACATLQASLNLEDGPVLRAAYIELGDNAAPRLLLAIHHLAVDGVSWRILLEDLQSGLEQAARNEPITFPAKTTSFQTWAQKLEEYGASDSLRDELDYWLSATTAESRSLPRDFAEPNNLVSSQQVVRVSLDAESTRSLLQEVPAVYHTQINDLLLTALARSFQQWTGQRSLLVDMEGHGREDLLDEVDLSRTVGWFTSLYPVRLELPASNGEEDALKTVKETLRSIPNRGIGYGILRYLSPDAAVGQRLSALPGAEISFNYHGVFDQPASQTGLFTAAPESAGPPVGPNMRRRYLIDVIGQVANDRLHVSWLYSDRIHRHSTVERLAESYLENVRALIAHCKNPDAGGFTPTDFPMAKVSQQSLDRLLSGFKKR